MYYANNLGKPFPSFTNHINFIFSVNENEVLEIYKNSKPIKRGDVENFPRWIKQGLLTPASEKLIKEYVGLVEDGYYGGADGKGFRVSQTINGKNRRSVYVMLRTAGDWESQMVTGPDFVNDFKKDSLEAAGFDEKVKSGEWKKVEVTEK
jgi:hypothetical protein